ncbi:MAG: GxxExxY protein [Patescibacteria group bacterium]
MNAEKIIYPELSCRIIGIAFKVFNELGFGMNEKYYQRAIERELKKEKIDYQKEKVVKLTYNSQSIGNYRLDFIIDNKIIIELKVRPRLGYVHIKQALSYLKSTNIKLAILVYFTCDGVKYRRILNIK